MKRTLLHGAIALTLAGAIASCKNQSDEEILLGGWESHELYLLNNDMSKSIHQAEFTVQNGDGFIEIPLVTFGVYRAEIMEGDDNASVYILPYPIDSSYEVPDEEVIYDITTFDNGYVSKKFIQTIRIESNTSEPCSILCRILASRGYDYYDYADITVRFE